MNDWNCLEHDSHCSAQNTKESHRHVPSVDQVDLVSAARATTGLSIDLGALRWCFAGRSGSQIVGD